MYEDIILPYIDGKYTINGSRELIGLCPFHDDTKPSFNINLETGLYQCHACGEKGNIVTFMSKMDNISTEEAYKLIYKDEYSNSTYKLDKFAREKHLNLDYLKRLGLANGYNSIKIPYYDEQSNLIGTRYRNDPKDKNKPRFTWKKGSKINLYGLNSLNDINSNDYIVLVEGESDALTLWSYGIPCVGVPRC